VPCWTTAALWWCVLCPATPRVVMPLHPTTPIPLCPDHPSCGHATSPHHSHSTLPRPPLVWSLPTLHPVQALGVIHSGMFPPAHVGDPRLGVVGLCDTGARELVASWGHARVGVSCRCAGLACAGGGGLLCQRGLRGGHIHGPAPGRCLCRHGVQRGHCAPEHDLRLAPRPAAGRARGERFPSLPEPANASSRLTPPPFALPVHCGINFKVFRRICTKLATHGKVLTVSLKGHFSTLADQQGMRMCPKGMAPHNTTPCMPFGEEKTFEVGATPVPFFLS